MDFETAGTSEATSTLECFRQRILLTATESTLTCHFKLRNPDMVAAIRWDLSRIH